MSYYKIIEGKQYDKELLDMGSAFADDGQISFAEATKLWECALDGPGVTACEKDTLSQLMKELKFTDKALHFLQKQVQGVKKGSYYKQIGGVKYAKDLLEMAADAQKDGSMDRASAVRLIQSSKDGPGITQCEQRTLEHILKHNKLSDDAKSLVREAVTPKHKGSSYYVQIQGVTYDRALLEQADKAAVDVSICLADAKALLDSACDGPGVTECEKRTLDHVLDVHKFTNAARKYLHKMLLGAHVLPAEVSATKDEAKADDVKVEVRVESVKVEVEENAAAKAEAEKEIKEQKTRARERALEKEEQRLTEADEKIGRLFDSMDEDRNGILAKAELDNYVRTKDEFVREEYGIANWNTFLEEADLDQDGKIARDEFVAFFSFGQAELDPERVFGALFDVIDISGDGILQQNEISEYQWYRNPLVFSAFGIDDFTQMVFAMDTNDDAKISREEFVEYLKARVGEGAGEVRDWKKMLETGRKQRKQCGAGFGSTPKTKDSCWDFSQGYCSRGKDCRWAHDASLDVAELSEGRKRNAQLALDEGLHFSHEAHLELQSLPQDEAEELIHGLAPGGRFFNVHAKSVFICKEVHRRNAKKSGTWGQKRQRLA